MSVCGAAVANQASTPSELVLRGQSVDLLNVESNACPVYRKVQYTGTDTHGLGDN